MKRLLLAFLALAFFSTVASAEGKKGELIFGGGVSKIFSPTEAKDLAKTGFNFSVGGGYGVSPTVTIGASFQYSIFGIDWSYARKLIEAGAGTSLPGLSGSGGKVNFMTFTGDLKFHTASTNNTPSPYGVIGLGFMNQSASGTMTATYRGQTVTFDLGSAAPDENAFMLNFGAGIDIPAGDKAGIFIEARYGVGFTSGKKTQYIPARVGLKVKL